MNFGKIRADIENDAKYTKHLTEVNKRIQEKKEYSHKSFPWWDYHDSSLEEFGHSFCDTLPKTYTDFIESDGVARVIEYGGAFRAYIEKTLLGNEHRAAVEFGGPGSSLFAGFKENYFEKTVGVCLEDMRTDEMKELDEEGNHHIYIGDILDVKNLDFDSFLKNTLEVEKVDLIVSRLMGPLKALSMNPLVMERVIDSWYSLLKENGLLFVQFQYHLQHNPSEAVRFYEKEIAPPQVTDTESIVEEWATFIQKQFPDTLELQLGRGVLRLHKKIGAPDMLPKMRDIGQ